MTIGANGLEMRVENDNKKLSYGERLEAALLDF